MKSVPAALVPVQPLRVQLKDEAAAHIRELIVSGQVPPGELLRLAPLAERIGASVTPVREALLLLAQDGWVVQEPNRGFRVAPITRRDVGDAYLVQSQVAGELAARAAVVIDDDALVELRRIDETIRTHVEGDEGFVEAANFTLHAHINDVAASPRLVWFADAAARFVPRRYWGTIPGWLDHNRYGHEPIVEALTAHDAEGARRAMSTHIDAAAELLLGHLDAIDFWAANRG